MIDLGNSSASFGGRRFPKSWLMVVLVLKELIGTEEIEDPAVDRLNSLL
jgi:hypothetical protein